jgi:hypothetical protein
MTTESTNLPAELPHELEDEHEVSREKYLIELLLAWQKLPASARGRIFFAVWRNVVRRKHIWEN